MLAKQIETLFYDEHDNIELAQDVGVAAFAEGYTDLGELLMAAQTPQDIADALCFNWPATKVAAEASVELGWSNDSVVPGVAAARKRGRGAFPVTTKLPRRGFTHARERQYTYYAFGTSFTLLDPLEPEDPGEVHFLNESLPYWHVLFHHLCSDGNTWRLYLNVSCGIWCDDFEGFWQQPRARVGELILDVAPTMAGFLGSVHELIGTLGSGVR